METPSNLTDITGTGGTADTENNKFTSSGGESKVTFINGDAPPPPPDDDDPPPTPPDEPATGFKGPIVYKSHLYSFTRTSEMRTVEADDPETTDVVETKEETWYIYTISYNGEEYFADTVFHLSVSQKELADNYAENLSLFLGDGTLQYAEYGGNTLPALGEVRFTDGSTDAVYFNQLDERYANKPYGTDNI